MIHVNDESEQSADTGERVGFSYALNIDVMSTIRNLTFNQNG